MLSICQISSGDINICLSWKIGFHEVTCQTMLLLRAKSQKSNCMDVNVSLPKKGNEEILRKIAKCRRQILNHEFCSSVVLKWRLWLFADTNHLHDYGLTLLRFYECRFYGYRFPRNRQKRGKQIQIQTPI